MTCEDLKREYETPVGSETEEVALEEKHIPHLNSCASCRKWLRHEVEAGMEKEVARMPEEVKTYFREAGDPIARKQKIQQTMRRVLDELNAQQKGDFIF